jgi:protein-disulfide isomerase
MSKRKELEAQRAKQRRKDRVTVAIVIGVMAVCVIGGAILLSQATQTQAAQLPAVKIVKKETPPNAEPNGRAWGPADAPIKIEEFLDYQCPSCAAFSREAEAGVIEAFAASGKVRFESNNFQFKGNESRRAGEAALCAAEQNEFWSMSATIFANQPAVHGEDDLGYFSDVRLKDMAQGLGMDMNAFSQCFDSRKHQAQVQSDFSEAEKLNIQQTPTFVINGKLYPGVQTADDFKRIFAEVAPAVTFP